MKKIGHNLLGGQTNLGIWAKAQEAVKTGMPKRSDIYKSILSSVSTLPKCVCYPSNSNMSCVQLLNYY